MIGTNCAASIALANEKFSQLDTADTYEKRIKPIAQTFVFNNIKDVLYNHLPHHIQMRVKIAAPADLNAFFTEVRNVWLEGGGGYLGSIGQQEQIQQYSSSENTKANDFIVRLAKDLDFSELTSDRDVLEKFIYNELQKRLGSKTAHIRKSPFDPIITNATKRIKKIIRCCSICGKTNHTKVNCPSRNTKGGTKKN